MIKSREVLSLRAMWCPLWCACGWVGGEGVPSATHTGLGDLPIVAIRNSAGEVSHCASAWIAFGWHLGALLGKRESQSMVPRRQTVGARELPETTGSERRKLSDSG